MLGLFHCPNDAAVGRVGTDRLHRDVKRAALVDRAGVPGARHLFSRRRFTRDEGLVNERDALGDDAVDGNPFAGPHEHDVVAATRSIETVLRPAGVRSTVAKVVEQLADRRASALDGHPFEDLGDQNEEDDDEGGECLADDQRRCERNRHRQLIVIRRSTSWAACR